MMTVKSSVDLKMMNGYSHHMGMGAAAGNLAYHSPVLFSAIQSDSSNSSSKTNQSTDEVVPNPYYYASCRGSPYASPTIQRRPFTQIKTQHSPMPQHFVMRNATIRPPMCTPMSQLRLNESHDSIGSDSHGSRVPPVRTTLPPRALDAQGNVCLSMTEILNEGLLIEFTKDKLGSNHVQDHYPQEDTLERNAIVKQILEADGVFETLCSDVFGNYVIQKMIKSATQSEQRWIVSHLNNMMYSLCLNRYSCRVVQTALECLPIDLKGSLLLELHKADLVKLAIDQNANHVLQRIMESFPLQHWAFIVEFFLTHEEALFAVVENKYGCRVIQVSIQMLTTYSTKSVKGKLLLENMMRKHITHCDRLSTNEFANYVIQHIIKTGPLSEFRDEIIEKCLLRNLLSLSQEKYASHVVEKALEYAPATLLKDMMEEIFDGYVPHPETKKDALDILLFHQYGNYVVQKMLDRCCEAYRARKSEIELKDMDARMAWLDRLDLRISQNSNRLSKYSSGKKIIQTLSTLYAKEGINNENIPYLVNNTSSTNCISMVPTSTAVPVPEEFR